MDQRTGELGSYKTLSQYLSPEDLLELTDEEFHHLKAMTCEARVQWAMKRQIEKKFGMKIETQPG